ncbi:cupin domain-containing protein [Rhodoferax aquaticus]|uniref:DUF861 domain-containing protein n=1 Tax=Rhodoferax aquaticus TaxID=2527691 RepID=A0A515ET22_9BURK|nr:cupin domain-containing protein [Rhodoferax aquaticus]QDL55819.1 DUF861 domain-containing protein [Rhodoferax aquaticus]
MKPFALPFIIGALCSAAGLSVYSAYQHVSHRPAPSAQAVAMPLAPLAIDPTWVKSGAPNFKSLEFGASTDASSSSGLFQADGASSFVWQYGLDEAIYILEGGVDIEYLGKRFTLKVGDTAFFYAGTSATWNVHAGGVKKTWTIYKPSKLARWAAKHPQDKSAP